MFALGLLSWMYGRPTDSTKAYLQRRFSRNPDIRDANIAAFNAGWNFGETTETFAVRYEIKPAPMPAGVYRNITGNLALSYGLVACAVQLGTEPVPRVLPDHAGLGHPPRAEQAQGVRRHHLPGRGRDRRHRRRDRRVLLRLARGDPTSGPGLALKSESIGLAVMTELPLLVIDVQRGGPSTGLPTKTEQSDLLQAMFGRNGEAPVPVVAPQSPGDCFDAALEAARIAVAYRTPVLLLSDGYLANGSEPWRIPQVDDMPLIDPAFATGPNRVPADAEDGTEPTGSGPTSATRTPWRARGRSRAPPASSTASAVSRRATGTATSPTTRPTTT